MILKDEYCPECYGILIWKEISQSGDGIAECPHCNWVESFDGTNESLKIR